MTKLVEPNMGKPGKPKRKTELEAKLRLGHFSRSRIIITKSMQAISRIKFKRESVSSYPRMLSDESDSRSTMGKKYGDKKYVGVTKTQSEENREILNPAICCHRDCCFAYNITNDVKNSAQLAESLPISVYQKLSDMWNLDPIKLPKISGNECKLLEFSDEEDKMVEEFIRSVERDLGILSNASQDLQVNVGSAPPSDISVDEPDTKEENPYLKVLKKLDSLNNKALPSVQLKKKAGKITKTIIKNFLAWYQSLGGNEGDTLIEASTLQELFQIGFNLPAAKTMGVRIKELPTVPECLANLMNDKMHSTRYQLKQLIKHDIKMENRPMKLFAFGSMLPKEHPPLRYKPPRNSVKKTWMECSRVPADLDSMKTVWGGLERLRSTIAFANWLKNNPEITPPKYLLEKGILDINYEEWNQMFKGFEPDAGGLEAEIDTKSEQEKPTLEAGSSSSSVGSYDSFI